MIGTDLNDFDHLPWVPWVVTAYLVSATLVTPLYGKIADIVGRRTTLLAAILIFILGSALCGLAPTMTVLIGARFFQGLGGGRLIALAQTIVGDIVPPRERMRYQAYFASVFVTASIVGGPAFGGFFSEHLHWSMVFWINLPIGGLALAMTAGVLRRLPRRERPHRLDVIGALLMAVAATTLLAVTGLGLGTIFPVTTVAIQNAVEPHQLGTVTASFNFFRSLGSAVLAAGFGTILLSGLGLGNEPIGTLDNLVAQAARNGTSIGPVFQTIFAVAATTLAIGLACFAAMEERPLR